MKENVASLLRYSPQNSDAVIEIVRWLKGAGFASDARTFFENAYLPAQAQLAQALDVPGSMNDLAWLEARCGERINESLELSQKAVQARPQSSAFLDTEAEASFAAGNRAKAIELETCALKLRRLDQFMQSQLKRFETAPLPATTQAAH